MVGENTAQAIDIYIYVKVDVVLNLPHFHLILCCVVCLGCFRVLCSVFLVCAIPRLLLDEFCFLQVSSASSSTPSLLYLFLSHFCTPHSCFSRHFGVPQPNSSQDNLVSSFLSYCCSPPTLLQDSDMPPSAMAPDFIGSGLSALGSGFIILCYVFLLLKKHYRQLLILNLVIAGKSQSSHYCQRRCSWNSPRFYQCYGQCSIVTSRAHYWSISAEGKT